MRGNVFSVLQLVRTIEVPDKQGPENRCYTVLLLILPYVLRVPSTKNRAFIAYMPFNYT